MKTFAVDDQISFVYKNTSDETKLAVSEKLTQSDISADGKTATIYVTFEDPATNSQLRMIYPATMANIPMSTSASIDDAGTINLEALQSGQHGYEGELSDYDLAVYDGTLNGYALPASVTLANKLAICAFTIKNDNNSQDITTTITNLTINDGTYNYSISRSNLISPIYVAMMPVADAAIEMTATANDGQHYAKPLSNITYAANNIYPLAMRMTESFKTYSTLTIQGTGTLNASARADAPGIGGANNHDGGNIVIKGGVINATGIQSGTGIGAGNNAYCGDITISGGTVTATAGPNGASGIGTSESHSSCGNILINGGTVIATGSNDGLGIGAGSTNCSCSNITIATTITSVTAIKGVNAPHYNFNESPCIGGVYDSNGYLNCGQIKFGSTEVYVGYGSWNSGMPTSSGTYGELYVTVSTNTWTLTPTNPNP